jgi:hypothetical protein
MALPPPALFLALCVTVGGVACSRKPGPQQESINTLDRADSARARPIRVVHRTFQVRKYAQFSFEIPPHTPIPRLHGTFRSFVPRAGQDPLSDDTTDVDFLLLTTDEFEDFSHGRGEGTAVYSIEPTHNHEVDFVLPPTKEDPAKYFVIFRNSPGGSPVETVSADFTVSFGY